MSPAGAATVAEAIRPSADIIASAGPGRLPQYQEKRAGALAALVEQYAIAVLDKPDWDRRKRDWGEAVYW